MNWVHALIVDQLGYYWDNHLWPRLDGLTDEEYWKLRLLVHTHDSFKAESKPGVAITDPRSHASLARAFLATHCDDPDLLAMVQFHDEPFALYRQAEFTGGCNPDQPVSPVIGRHDAVRVQAPRVHDAESELRLAPTRAGNKEGWPQIALETFFREAPAPNPSRRLIQGVVCGVRVEDIQEPTMREIRYLDKLVDELAKGKAMDKILRAEPGAAPDPARDIGSGTV